MPERSTKSEMLRLAPAFRNMFSQHRIDRSTEQIRAALLAYSGNGDLGSHLLDTLALTDTECLLVECNHLWPRLCSTQLARAWDEQVKHHYENDYEDGGSLVRSSTGRTIHRYVATMLGGLPGNGKRA